MPSVVVRTVQAGALATVGKMFSQTGAELAWKAPWHEPRTQIDPCGAPWGWFGRDLSAGSPLCIQGSCPLRRNTKRGRCASSRLLPGFLPGSASSFWDCLVLGPSLTKEVVILSLQRASQTRLCLRQDSRMKLMCY